jgi:hypothetical protein
MNSNRAMLTSGHVDTTLLRILRMFLIYRPFPDKGQGDSWSWVERKSTTMKEGCGQVLSETYQR